MINFIFQYLNSIKSVHIVSTKLCYSLRLVLHIFSTKTTQYAKLSVTNYHDLSRMGKNIEEESFTSSDTHLTLRTHK